MTEQKWLSRRRSGNSISNLSKKGLKCGAILSLGKLEMTFWVRLDDMP